MLEFSVTERGKEFALSCRSEYELWCLFTWITKPNKDEVNGVNYEV